MEEDRDKQNELQKSLIMLKYKLFDVMNELLNDRKIGSL